PLAAVVELVGALLRHLVDVAVLAVGGREAQLLCLLLHRHGRRGHARARQPGHDTEDRRRQTDLRSCLHDSVPSSIRASDPIVLPPHHTYDMRRYSTWAL